MRNLLLGIIIGSALTGTVVGAQNFYTPGGKPSAPTGSVQQYDYFRFRQQMIDINQMNQRAKDAAANRFASPCR